MTHINEAGPMNLLRTLFIILIAYYAVRFVVKLFAPYLIKKAVDKVQKKAAQQYQSQQEKRDVEEGKTIIDKKPQNGNQSNNSVGEYVDFEEID